MPEVFFRNPEGRKVRIPVVDGKVNVAKVKRWFGASDVSFFVDGVECFLEAEEGSDLSTDSFQENSLVDIHCRTDFDKEGDAEPLDAFLDKPTATYFSKFADIPSPSSLAKKMKDYHLAEKPAYKKFKYQTPGNEVFLNYRPDTVCGAPISLASSIFGKFRDTCKEGKVSRRSCEFIWELCEHASKFYNNEDGRLQVMQKLLKEILPPGFGFEAAVPGQADSDIYIVYGDHVVGVLEGKPEPGFNGDSQMQISGCYEQLCNRARKEPSVIFLSTNFPMLTIEVVGPSLRIGGAVFVDAPVLEPLTPLLHLFRIKDSDHMNQLVRVCHAMREALIELAAFNLGAATAPKIKRNLACLSLPYLMQQWYSEGARFRQAGTPASARAREVYSYVVDLDKWVGDDQVLVGSLSKGHKKAFVKVCQGYGSTVHKAWLEKGCAPELFGECKLPGGWSIVVMEFKEGWRTLFDISQWARREVWKGVCEKARGCLAEAQKAEIRGVHGDLRLPNVLVSSDLSEVCFIDFGWAAIEGEGVYPNYMNHCDITWPDGAAEGEPMKQEHDRKLLETELTKNLKTLTICVFKNV